MRIRRSFSKEEKLEYIKKYFRSNLCRYSYERIENLSKNAITNWIEQLKIDYLDIFSVKESLENVEKYNFLKEKNISDSQIAYVLTISVGKYTELLNIWNSILDSRPDYSRQTRRKNIVEQIKKKIEVGKTNLEIAAELCLSKELVPYYVRFSKNYSMLKQLPSRKRRNLTQKIELTRKVKQLRQEGKTFDEISKILNIPKTTANYYQKEKNNYLENYEELLEKVKILINQGFSKEEIEKKLNKKQLNYIFAVLKNNSKDKK